MAGSERPALHVVDPETGELHGTCPNCAELQDQLDGVEKELRAWRSRYAALRRDKDAEAQGDPLWGWGVALFYEWRFATGHVKSAWTADRFFLCKPYLDHDGFPVCRLAVWGIAAHPNTKRITATYEEVYDDWELVFRNRATFERYANRGWAVFGDRLPVDMDSEAVKRVLRVTHVNNDRKD